MQGGFAQQRFFRQRRYALLIRGCLRGLIKPDYPNGELSQLREEIVLQTLAAEEGADLLEKNIRLSQAMLPVAKVDALRSIVASIQERLERVHALRTMDLAKVRKLDRRVSAEQLSEAYSKLVSSGTLKYKEATEENMDDSELRQQMQRDIAAGILKPVAGIGAR